MSFLSPTFLWALPLFALPVLIHLFGKRKREVIRWGAMEFLLGSATPRRRLFRLRDLILMLLRVAAVLIIIAALAQPMFSSKHLGSAGPRDVVLILDNSMSTGRKSGSENIFIREIAEVNRLLQRLNPADRVRLLLSSPRPAWLTPGPISPDSIHISSLVNELHELRPSNGAADLLDVVQRAISAQPAGKDFTRFVTVVTDGQAYGWHAETPGQWASIRTLAGKVSPPVFLNVIAVGSAPAISNLSIDKLTVDRAVVAIGQPVTCTATIKNNGTAASSSGALEWHNQDRSLGLSSIASLEPGAATTVRISQPFAAPGIIEISCKLGTQDDLSADDSMSVLLEVTRAVKVLLVQGDPRTDPVQSETQCFLAALGYREDPKASPSSAFQVKVIDYHLLPTEVLSDFQCIVLADVPRLPKETVQKLGRFVTTGGGLWVALGEQTDIREFNETFFEQGIGISPLGLLQPVGNERDPKKFVGIAPPSAEHPATALLADLQRLDIDRVKIYRHHQFATAAGNTVPVLLRAEGGAPLVAEKNPGRGRVIVQTFPLGLAWSNLPLCHSFVVMVHEWLWYLAEPSLVKRNLKPGELVELSHEISGSEMIGSLEIPGGAHAQVIGAEQDGRLLFRYSKTQAPGVYTLTIPGSAEGSHSEKFRVGRDPEESNLTPLSAQQMQTLSQAGSLEFGGEAFRVPAGHNVIAQPKPLAAWFLIALLIALLAESVITFLSARHKRAPATVAFPETAIHA